MRTAVVLDAGALDGTELSAGTRALIERTLARGGELWCCAVNLAEVCRGRDRTARVESFLRRSVAGTTVQIRDTDEHFAKRVGSLLAASRRGSDALADAHVVALAAEFDVAIVITTDPDDIAALADHVPATRLVTRPR